jgi:hypothetical protein
MIETKERERNRISIYILSPFFFFFSRRQSLDESLVTVKKKKKKKKKKKLERLCVIIRKFDY